MAIYLDIQPVLLTAAGVETEVQKTDYTKKLSDGTTVALDGSEGHVMMRVSLFYASFSQSAPQNTWKLAPARFSGSQPFRGFWNGSKFLSKIYIGIYPGSWYDVSAVGYVDGDGICAAFDTSADKLGSVAGKKPVSNKTRAQFRAAADRIGTGWTIFDANAWEIVKLLAFFKSGTFRTGQYFGYGNTRYATAVGFAEAISATGKVAATTAPGQSTASGNSGDYSNILGFEDLIGGLYEFIDGINIISNYELYKCSDYSKYADDTTTGYELICTFPATSGWIDTLANDIGVYPATVGSDRSVGYSGGITTGNKILRYGLGYYNNGDEPHLQSYNSGITSTTINSAIGTRLVYYPAN
jgi:hypothetical protein